MARTPETVTDTSVVGEAPKPAKTKKKKTMGPRYAYLIMQVSDENGPIPFPKERINVVAVTTGADAMLDAVEAHQHSFYQRVKLPGPKAKPVAEAPA